MAGRGIALIWTSLLCCQLVRSFHAGAGRQTRAHGTIASGTCGDRPRGAAAERGAAMSANFTTARFEQQANQVLSSRGASDASGGEMGPQDVVAHVLNAFRPGDDEDDDVWQFSNTQQEVAGTAFQGARVLVSYSVKTRSKFDDVGCLQPGGFGYGAVLEDYLLANDDYRTFALLSEWRALGPPESGGERCVVQKLLVRQKDGNWEEARMTLELCDTPRGERWLVRSVYKDYHDRGGVERSGGYDADDADPEEARNC
jgi:hypothetical protein